MCRKTSLLANLVLLVLLAIINTASAACPDNIISHWRLDETIAGPVIDSVGTSDAAIVGNVAINQPGQVDTAYLFDGSGDKINIPDFDLSGKWSICFWAKVDLSAGMATYYTYLSP